MGKNEKPNPILSKEKPWLDNKNPIWLASTLMLSRNIEKYKFPGKMSNERQKQVISLEGNTLSNSKELKKPELLKAEEIPPIEKEFLMEHFLSSESFHQAHTGDAFIIDDTGEYLVTLNIHDHLQIIKIDCREDLENTWNHLVKIEMELGKVINYAFNTRFGFLTSDPQQCGTGLTVSAFLQPSALIHTDQLVKTLEKIAENGVVISGLQGGIEEYIGDILIAKNNYYLGVTEETIISTIRTFITKLIVEEKSLRTKIKKEKSPEVKDKVSRAYGVLIHSYQIETIEALDAISLIKLGVDLGWLEGASINDLNNLFFNCRRAHLTTKFKEEIAPEELSHKRAEYIHKSLEKLTLTI